MTIKQIVSYFFIYLSFLFLSWILVSYTSFATFQNSVDDHASRNQELITDKIFKDLFAKAQECKESSNAISSALCSISYKYKIAEILVEQDFFSGKTWPNELFFIKEENGDFTQIDWSGDTENITKRVQTAQLNSYTPYFIQYLMRSCKPFQTPSSASSYCEFYSRVELDNQATGYVVRQHETSPEYNYFQAIIFPISTIVSTVQMLIAFDPSRFYLLMAGWFLMGSHFGMALIARSKYRAIVFTEESPPKIREITQIKRDSDTLR